ncbi:MAG: GTP 3',8-cyclase MoaA [Bacteroidota bacterium]|nr:GTP 3',8-cyclase MoaA [Bacteroidota bacterium]
MGILKDKYGRIHNYLRVSLTDMCNLNCSYCNPEGADFKHTPKFELLTYEETQRLISIFVRDLNFNKIRLTGGEPLVRKNIETFFTSLNLIKKEYPFKLGITTNGLLLKNKIDILKENGIDYLNISLDTLNKEQFRKITGSDSLSSVLEAIDCAVNKGFKSVKINTVVMKNLNTNEIPDFLRYVEKYGINIRFIEYMPFSGNGWNKDYFISMKEIINIVKSYADITPISNNEASVAKDYIVKGSNVKVSFISSISDDFCSDCNRLRITSDGHLKLCLFSNLSDEINLKKYVRDSGFSDSDIAEIIRSSLLEKKLKHPEIDELLKANKNNMFRIGG